MYSSGQIDTDMYMSNIEMNLEYYFSNVNGYGLGYRCLIPGKRSFLSAINHTQSLSYTVCTRVFFLWIKHQERGTDDSLPSSAGVQNVWSSTFTLTLRPHDVVFWQRDNVPLHFLTRS